MAFALSSSTQRVQEVSRVASSLGRSSFTGSRTALAPVIKFRQSARQITPQALFTRNKEDKGRKTGYDKGAFEVDPIQPAFTRRRELFVISTGLGPLGQLQLELGLPSYAVDLLVLGTVAYSFIGGLNPKSPTFSAANQRDVKKRGAGPTQKPQINAVSNPGDMFGATEFGFSKKNELLVGRTAQLGFLAAVIGEKVTGFGPLKQFGLETGIPLGQASVLLVAFISFFLVAAIFNGEYGDKAIDEDRTY
ncbi:hypothetical protein COCSUDRAFT_59631 [Coccomyxa subellipsoidea C-169]|uniref:Uncharacterized protein n=1 Tax=Coccomyxa subellipsoidea (strain C-169) TaxID=574566 RepID=I0YL79_COCSC|nr:hypothetical protein COCSUDRAFT_59631 [Coccomyxa subellipsoidea C-169]EIE19148.1 hypothetical protein COCSUDRAFT_59631 [Coccomyxa subellipsoidea C-169]|eukprot:XP_005643692.1 hypothetical protein COCSUDRAFT_59631 [Coccomyxa subellipsoidea C-169]